MTSTSPRAFARLASLSATYREAEEEQEKTRQALHEAIVRHLRARNARPGAIAQHTPYDRVWIGALGRQATPPVPPLKGPNATGPTPTYKPTEQAAALTELDRLTQDLQRASAAIDETRPLIHAEIIRHYTAGVSPEELSVHTPYDRKWIGEIARAGSTVRQRQKSQSPRKASEAG
ncbi:hypothetical protein [Streptomyces sp. SGAir0957]